MLKCCIVTGSRAEYGLLKPLMRCIEADKKLQLQLLVTGMHLSPEFGSTYEVIENDGFVIDEKVEMLLSGDKADSIIKSMGVGMIGYADALRRLAPNWVIVLGDRFEILATTIAAHILNIPIAHISGGEVTKGSTDEAFRHSITKMSYLHFTAAEVYRNRVIQLGEAPDRVYNTGAIGIDSIRSLTLLSKRQLSKELGLAITDKTLMVTFHPVTLERNTAEMQMKNILKALLSFPDCSIIFTLPNADADGKVITSLIHDFETRNPGRCKSFTSLGQIRYLSALKYVSAVIGNSSSGITEAPLFKVPTINIGDRQDGRLKAISIIDTSTDVKSICAGIRKAFSPEFLDKIKETVSLYGNGQAAIQIVNVIKKHGRLKTTKKEFFDLPNYG